MKMRDPSFNMGTTSNGKYVLTGLTGRYLGVGDAFAGYGNWNYDPLKVKIKNVILDYRNSPGGKQMHFWETGGHESPGWLMDGYRTAYQSSTTIEFEDVYAIDYNGHFLYLWTDDSNFNYVANRGPYLDGNSYPIGGHAFDSRDMGPVTWKGLLTGGITRNKVKFLH